jgi:hypothetical protein
MRNTKHAMRLGLILFVASLCASNAFGQVKYVELPNGKKVVLKGLVRPGGAPFYVFNAKPGQQLSVRLISPNRHVEFGIDVVFNIDGPEIVSDAIVEEKTIWSGHLPELDSNQFGIGVKTRAGRAAYTLEITLR